MELSGTHIGAMDGFIQNPILVPMDKKI